MALHCKICSRPLTGGLDTYGDVGQELCWTCFSDNQEGRAVYGLFPGGDPREFTPDFEVCAQKQIQKWREDCDAWDHLRGENVPKHAYGPGVYYV